MNADPTGSGSTSLNNVIYLVFFKYILVLHRLLLVVLYKFYNNYRGLYKIEIQVNTTAEFVAFVSDPSAGVSYQLPHNLITGDVLSLQSSLETPVWKYYNIQLYEDIGLQSQEACAHYSGQTEYTSYTDCVDQENYKAMIPVFGCAVPWMSASHHQCQAPLKRQASHDALIRRLKFLHENAMTGFQYRPTRCLPPCKVLISKARYLRTLTGKMITNRLRIYLSENVETRKGSDAYQNLRLFLYLDHIHLIGLYQFLDPWYLILDQII